MTSASRRLARKLEKEEKQIYFAIENDDVSELQKLISDGINVDLVFEGSNQWRKSALHLCCEKGRLSCAHLLCQAGADVNRQDDWYQTPLMYSVSTERTDMVKLLIDADADLDLHDKYGKTALHLCVGNSDSQCLQLLLEGGAEVDSYEALGRTALWQATSEDGKLEFLERLISAGCDVNSADRREKRTPLQMAINNTKTSTVDYVRQLLAAGADTNTIDQLGWTPMTALIRRDRSHGNTVDPTHLQMARMLLDAGYNVDVCKPPKLSYQFHGTCLKAAVERGSEDYVKMLLEAGADVDAHDNSGATPLLHAVKNSHMHIIKILISANCNLNALGILRLSNLSLPVTPFRCAIYKDNLEVAELLVHAGCDLQKEEYLLNNDDVPDTLVIHYEFWGWLRELVMEPRCLQDLCRATVRSQLGRKLAENVASLPVPQRVRDYLLLEKLLAVN